MLQLRSAVVVTAAAAGAAEAAQRCGGVVVWQAATVFWERIAMRVDGWGRAYPDYPQPDRSRCSP